MVKNRTQTVKKLRAAVKARKERNTPNRIKRQKRNKGRALAIKPRKVKRA